MQGEKKKVNLAVFASGSGSNTEAIVAHFENSKAVDVKLIVTNRANAGVIDRAKRLNVPVEVLLKSEFDNQNEIIELLKGYEVEWIILAGWLLLVPEYLVAQFQNRIINIHPALLPKFGGKGMYGRHVHEAVKDAGEVESGVTIHYVNERFDEGGIIKQFAVKIDETDSVNDIEMKVRKLELENYPSVIEKTLLSK